jgi:hypothetical protein
MFASDNQIVKWTNEGVNKGATAFFIIHDDVKKKIYPYWVMPGETLEEARGRFCHEKKIVDAVSTELVDKYYLQLDN